jgi:hypothetical protein
VKPRLYTDKGYGPRFHPLLHTSYTMDFLTAPLREDVFSGYYVQKEGPGLCPVKGQIGHVLTEYLVLKMYGIKCYSCDRQTQYIFYFILILYFTHNGMSSTKKVVFS